MSPFTEEFENRAVTLKAHQRFPSSPRRRNFKTQQSAVILDLYLGKLGQGNHVIIMTSSFLKNFVFRPNGKF